jgi:predicted ATPase
MPAAPFVTAMLSACPQVTVLATSRAPLHLRGEREWDLSPLELPSATAAQTVTEVAGTDAVRLFVERATAVLPDFTLTKANAATVAEICHRVDGLPLGLELAAARLKVLSPSALLARLDEHQLQVLTGGAHDLPARQQTMRETVAWSYDLLEAPERALFRRLAVFAGGWTLEAAEAVTNLQGDLDVLDGLTALVNGSLVRHRHGASSEWRFEMLETVRAYGLEQLAASGESLRTREAHAAWLLNVVRQAGPGLLVEDHAAWLARLDDELANLRAALAQTLERGDVATAVQLAATPWLYWFESGRTNEGRSWLERALSRVDRASVPVRAMARSAAGSLAATQGDYGPANALLEAALADWTALGEQHGIARTLHTLAVVALERNEDQRAAGLLEQALAEYGPPRTKADASWVALAVTHQACAWSGIGEHERAIALGEQAVTMQREAGSQIGVALGVTFLADFALDRGEYAAARTRYLEGVTMMWDLDDRWHLLYALTGLAIVTAELGPPERAARLLGAQAAAREAYGNRLSPRRRVAYDAALANVRATLGEPAFSASWAAGMSLGLDGAVAEILRD